MTNPPPTNANRHCEARSNLTSRVGHCEVRSNPINTCMNVNKKPKNNYNSIQPLSEHLSALCTKKKHKNEHNPKLLATLPKRKPSTFSTKRPTQRNKNKKNGSIFPGLRRV